MLGFIQTYTAKRGIAPSYAVIARSLGVKSRATIAKHVAALERRGLLRRLGNDGAFELLVTTKGMRCPKCNYEFLLHAAGD